MIIISSCLVGIPCRYNGKDFSVPDLTSFIKNYHLINVCPEILGGLSVPRSPCEIKISKNGVSVV
jgi:D-alanine-D-alanine ligase